MLIGGAAASWSVAVRAQQPGMPVIGFMHGSSPEAFARPLAAFRQGLSETGFIEDHNVKIEYRWAESQYDRLPGMAVLRPNAGRRSEDSRVRGLPAPGVHHPGRSAVQIDPPRH